MPSLSEAPIVSIAEVTGDTRVIELAGRALPYQRVGWSGTTTHKLTFYPGNPEGTMQVLGPTEEPTTMSGMWKARFLPGQVQAIGFPDLVPETTTTPEILVAAFESLRRAGQRLEVQWGGIVREGILSRFSATWIRPQDVEWEAEFTWFSYGVSAPRAAAAPQAPRGQLRQAMDRRDASLGQVPKRTVSPDYLDDVRATTRESRVQLATMFSSLAVIAQERTANGTGPNPFDPLGSFSLGSSGQVPRPDPVNALLASAESIRRNVEASVEALEDVPYTLATVSDRVADVLGVERWRRTVGLSESVLGEAARVVADAEREARLALGLAERVVMPADATLRTLALRYYGNADSWQLIADANGIVGSFVAPGTVLVIPPAPSR